MQNRFHSEAWRRTRCVSDTTSWSKGGVPVSAGVVLVSAKMRTSGGLAAGRLCYCYGAWERSKVDVDFSIDHVAANQPIKRERWHGDLDGASHGVDGRPAISRLRPTLELADMARWPITSQKLSLLSFLCKKRACSSFTWKTNPTKD